jgi:NADH:ubiquinone oxidoreductase subunit 2 (subunit N)
LYLIAFIVLAVSVISTFYYISVVKTIYFEKGKNWILYQDVSKEMSVLLSISLFLMFFLFFNPNILLLCSQKMALSLV